MSKSRTSKGKAFVLGGLAVLAIAMIFVLLRYLTTGEFVYDLANLTMLFGIGGVFALILSSVNSKGRRKRKSS
jgi:hypothetical protein